MRESAIETTVSRYATTKGWLAYKFSSPNRRGVPDHLYLKDGKTIFIEFKAPGKKLTKLQIHTCAKIMAQNFEVYRIDSIITGKELFDEQE